MVIKVFGKEFTPSRSLIIYSIPFALILVGIIGLLLGRSDEVIVFKEEQKNKIEQTYSKVESKSSDIKQETKIEDEIKVNVVGCVNNPGIVTLKKGQLVDDAINLAGGLTEEADISNINLVYKLKENVTLKILPKSEKVSSANLVQGSTEGARSQAGAQINSSMEYVTEAGSAVVIDNSSGGQTKSGGKVNINTASIEQLDTMLPGVGVETAKDIIAFREKNGDFKVIQDIMKVSGIKESRFSNIQDLITVD
ncbi:MAG: hypothetical protein K0R31_1390 [Clostridiales bacterium]|jgi:competence protein ComEA|nr:hypothetical protein [Clostridiales bacterium]